MNNEDDLLAATRRASRAKLLVEDEIIVEAFKALERAYHDGWAQSELHESKKRDTMYLALQVLGDVQKHLMNVISNGVIAQSELEAFAVKYRKAA